MVTLPTRLSQYRALKKAWRKLLEEVRPDVVHVNCCWMPQSAWTQKWAQQAGYKVVLSPHGMLEPWIMARHYWTRKVPALWLYQKQAVVKADRLHATAESEVEDIRKAYLSLISDQSLRDMLLQKGQENIEKYRAEKISCQYCDIYSVIEHECFG